MNNLTNRNRNLRQRLSTLIFQPGSFFRSLPALSSTRHWLWAAVFILSLTGLTAIERRVLSEAAALSGDTASTWTTALLAAANIILMWLIQMVLLCEVSLFNGFRPQWGRNLQIAIWSSLPLGLMAALQFLYFRGGGSFTGPELAGLLAESPGFAEVPEVAQDLLLSLASQLTLFWIWQLALLYLGARHGLNGKWWSSLLVVTLWVLLAVLAPVAVNRLMMG
jgi:hypothetical protein